MIIDVIKEIRTAKILWIFEWVGIRCWLRISDEDQCFDTRISIKRFDQFLACGWTRLGLRDDSERGILQIRFFTPNLNAEITEMPTGAPPMPRR
jgi:hypothetical protein